MYYLSRSSKNNREGVDSRLIEMSDMAISITVVDFGHPKHSGNRTSEEQYQLYLDQKSKRDGKKLISDHQFGKALDFYAFVGGKASWNEYHLAMVAAAFLQSASILGYRAEWGGLWGGNLYDRKGEVVTGVFRDYPHIALLEDYE